MTAFYRHGVDLGFQRVETIVWVSLFCSKQLVLQSVRYQYNCSCAISMLWLITCCLKITYSVICMSQSSTVVEWCLFGALPLLG